MASATNLRERIETTLRAFLSAFEEGSTQGDASLVNRDVTADCKRHMLPESVHQVIGLPPGSALDRAQYQELFAKDMKALKFTKNAIANLVIDTEARRASFTSFAEVHPRNGESFTSEQAWVLYFDEDADKVNKVVEFCDKDTLLKMANSSA